MFIVCHPGCQQILPNIYTLGIELKTDLIYWLELETERLSISSWHDKTLVSPLLHHGLDDLPLHRLEAGVTKLGENIF